MRAEGGSLIWSGRRLNALYEGTVRFEAASWATQDHPAAGLLAREAGRITPMAEGDALMTGVRLWGLPGHTPGQMGLVIDGQVVVLGDTLRRAGHARLPGQEETPEGLAFLRLQPQGAGNRAVAP